MYICLEESGFYDRFNSISVSSDTGGMEVIMETILAGHHSMENVS